MKTKQIKKEFEAMDTLISEVDKELAFIKSSNKRLKKLIKKVDQLEAFYYSDEWLEQRDILTKDKSAKSHPSASEDVIWNLSQDFYDERIKMLKTLTKSL